jgi:hypothetical protein
LARSEIRRSSSFTICVRVQWGSDTCGTKSLHWCCRNIEFYTTLRSALSASSSMLVRDRNPHVRSTRVCHRIPVKHYIITNSVAPYLYLKDRTHVYLCHSLDQ